MENTKDFSAKVQEFAARVSREQIESLHRRSLACEANLANARTRVMPGRKYTKVDIGNPDSNYWSGRYMVENETGRIYGCKGYGVIHRGHYFGTLDTVDAYAWGEYRACKRPEPETHAATCEACGRVFEDESAELVADILDAHKAIAHKPEPAPFIPDEHADAGARILQYRPRAEFRRATPDDEPEPTGTDGGSGSAEPKGGPVEAVKVTRVRDAFGARCLDCGAVFTELTPWHWRKSQAMHERGAGHRTELFTLAEPAAESSPAGQPEQAAGALTASRDTLRALKIINDAAVLELKRAGGCYGRTDCARVTLAGVETVVNVAKLDKWAATFGAGDVFTVELDEQGLTLSRGSSYLKLARQVDAPANLTPIELHASDSGEVTAPALPDPAEMKAARKELADGRKALKAERVRQNALRDVHSATADVKRAEDYAARLEAEAREVIRRAEELTEAECDEAVSLAKRVRDLRRLRREVERAAEDPQINTPEFFDWLDAEHRTAYAEAFEPYARAVKRGWGRKAETARGALGGVLRRAFRERFEPELAEITEAEDWHDIRARAFGRRFDIEPQAVKRTLRELSRRIPAARARVAEARERRREALEAFAPHVREDERERYERLLAA